MCRRVANSTLVSQACHCGFWIKFNYVYEPSPALNTMTLNLSPGLTVNELEISLVLRLPYGLEVLDL